MSTSFAIVLGAVGVEGIIERCSCGSGWESVSRSCGALNVVIVSLEDSVFARLGVSAWLNSRGWCTKILSELRVLVVVILLILIARWPRCCYGCAWIILTVARCFWCCSNALSITIASLLLAVSIVVLVVVIIVDGILGSCAWGLMISGVSLLSTGWFVGRWCVELLSVRSYGVGYVLGYRTRSRRRWECTGALSVEIIISVVVVGSLATAGNDWGNCA